MARLYLSSRDTTAESMPDVCLVCGQPSTTIVNKTFACGPEWLSILALLVCLIGAPLIIVIVILYFVLAKRMKVAVPTCDRHARYWIRRVLWMFVPMGALVVACMIAWGFMVAEQEYWRMESVAAMPCFGFAAFAIIWLIVAGVIQSQMIRAKEITDRGITLVRVHEDFIAAFEEKQEQDDYDDDYDPPPRRRISRESDEPDRRDTFRAE